MRTTTANASAEASHVIADTDEPPAAGSDRTDWLEIRDMRAPAGELDVQWLLPRLSQAMRAISDRTGRPVGQVDIAIVDDAGMIELNRAHAGVDHTTDVLSFDLSDGSATPIQADIAVCAAEAARRAAELHHSIERELLLYCVHGVLHCAGFDDQTESGFTAMHAEEDRILKLIGVGATFQPDAAPEGSASA